jgi:hypothetical protein
MVSYICLAINLSSAQRQQNKQKGSVLPVTVTVCLSEVKSLKVFTAIEGYVLKT